MSQPPMPEDGGSGHGDDWPVWLDNQPDWLNDAPARDEEEPFWLDEERPLDPEGDDREWPGDWDAVAAEAADAQAEEVKDGPGGGFGQGEPLDTAAPGLGLAGSAEYASGADRDFAGVSDDELFGLLGARRRLVAWQCWERLMTVAAFIRRRPAPGVEIDKPTGMPAVWEEGAAGELHVQLAITRNAADQLLSLAWDLIVKLPLTSRMLRDGIIDEDKASTISRYCASLTPQEARLAEQILFAADGIEAMTWGMIRDRIARAVMLVNPDAARKRREDAARDRRIEVRAEESGNAMLAGRELPPVAVVAMDQEITARARVLRKLGVRGSMDELRVQAFLERWGQADPLGDAARRTSASPVRAGGVLSGQIHLTAPVTTMTEMAGRPGVLRGVGPIDPDMTRDLAEAASRHPGTGYHFTITDRDGRPVAHACGKPEKPGKPGTRPPGGARLEVIDRGPPGSYGTWRYIHGDRVIIFEFENLAGRCDHKHQAAGHDPGRLLRHLTGVLNQTCTQPACRRQEGQCDYEHARPWDRGGITCLCEAGPVCRRDHRDKQRRGWKVEGAGARGWFKWTTPSGRSYLAKPTVYPI